MVSRSELEQVKSTLASAPGGLTFGELRELLGGEYSDNALRYRLRLLREAGDVVTTGTTRAVRYSVSRQSGHVRESDPSGDLIFGPRARRLLDLTARPIEERAPVGYRSELLDDYEPGRTRLVSRALSDRLRALGTTDRTEAPAGTYIREVLERLLIDLSWASSHLEGNTYSLLETRRLIEHGEAAEGRDARETQMVLNHKRAIEFLVQDVGPTRLRRAIALNLHAILAENLLADPSSAGALRSRPVAISGSTYVPLSNPQRIAEYFERILAISRHLTDPIEESFFVFAHLAYLQPFIDVNKRTARLAANIPLFRANLKPLTFLDVPRTAYLNATLAFYEAADPTPILDLYAWAYQRSCARYEAVVDDLPQPDLFRQKYRDQIYDAVRNIVVSETDEPDLAADRRAAELFGDPGRRARFSALVLADVHGLHEGNFMRYRITPSEFERWAGSR